MQKEFIQDQSKKMQQTESTLGASNTSGRFCSAPLNPLPSLRSPKHPSSRRACPPSPNGGFSPPNPSSQLVIGYHWLAFLNQVIEQSKHTVDLVPNSLGILRIKSAMSQKINIIKLGNSVRHSFQNIAHLLRLNKLTFLVSY